MDEDENNWIKSVLNVINPKDGTDYWLGGANNGWGGDGTWMGIHPSMYWVSSLYSWLTGNLLNYSVFSSQKLKSRSSIVSLHCTILRQCNGNWDLSNNDSASVLLLFER